MVATRNRGTSGKSTDDDSSQAEGAERPKRGRPTKAKTCCGEEVSTPTSTPLANKKLQKLDAVKATVESPAVVTPVRRSRRLSGASDTPVNNLALTAVDSPRRSRRISELSDAGDQLPATNSPSAVRQTRKRLSESSTTEASNEEQLEAKEKTSAKTTLTKSVRKSRRLSGSLDVVPESTTESDEQKKETISESDNEPSVQPIAAKTEVLPTLAEEAHEDSFTETQTKEKPNEKPSEEEPTKAPSTKVPSPEPAPMEVEKASICENKENVIVKESDDLTKKSTEIIKKEDALEQLARIMLNNVPRQKPKSGRFWKAERSQFRQIRKDKGHRKTFEERIKAKEEQQRAKELAEMLLRNKIEKKQELRKRIEENKKRREERERKAEVYQIVRNPNKIKKLKKKDLAKRDILDKVQIVK